MHMYDFVVHVTYYLNIIFYAFIYVWAHTRHASLNILLNEKLIRFYGLLADNV